jgi:chemotaxis protein CheC
MTNSLDTLPRGEVDRLCELASVGAGFAATALGRILGTPVFNRAPKVREAEDPAEAPRWSTGILFESDGDLTGIVAIVLSADERDRTVAKMIGRSDFDREIAESALSELGNIIASQTVSAIADSLDATILLSVPTLAMEDAGAAIRSSVRRRGAPVRIETDLCGPDGGVFAVLVLVPDPAKPEATGL